MIFTQFMVVCFNRNILNTWHTLPIFRINISYFSPKMRFEMKSLSDVIDSHISKSRSNWVCALLIERKDCASCSLPIRTIVVLPFEQHIRLLSICNADNFLQGWPFPMSCTKNLAPGSLIFTILSWFTLPVKRWSAYIASQIACRW